MFEQFTKAGTVGEQILQGFEKGRAKAIAQKQAKAALHRSVVMINMNADQEAGRPARGMAGRICRRLRGVLSERRIRQIISEVLMSVSDSLAQDGRPDGLSTTKRKEHP